MNTNLIEELKHIAKSIIKENLPKKDRKYITEIERYIPGIDSPEDEEEIEKSMRNKEKDIYKSKDPFKNLKSDDFYDIKLKDNKLKNFKKDNQLSNDSYLGMKQPDNYTSNRDISYLGDWKKKLGATKYYDKYKNLINTDDDYTPAKKNKINTPQNNKQITTTKPSNLGNSKIEINNQFNKDLNNILNNIINNKQDNNPNTINSAVIRLETKYPKYFLPIYSHEVYDLINGELKRTIDIQNKQERIKKIKELILETSDQLKYSSKNLMKAFKMKDKISQNIIIEILNDINFFNNMLNKINNAKSY